MNETEIIFYAIISFAVGYYLAFIATSIGSLAKKYGFFVIFVFPFIISALYYAEIITKYNSIVLSTALAIGFLIKLLRK
ncbi:hypothetical protein [uncultured Gammaproteobacteria bacterium]|nr:hypothetical protein [uncultured Gammaproteobacteria bacterium]